jgi:lycopene cyclase-like protein
VSRPQQGRLGSLASGSAGGQPGAVRPADAIELWIIGAGPAALLLAGACVARGVRLGLLAPEPRHAWAPNYALWLDDAVELGVEPWLGQRWAEAEARFARGPRVLDRGYALLDDRRLQLDLLRELEAAGARVEAGTLTEIVHDDEGVELRCEGGARLRGRLVVDASGHGSAFVAREQGPAPAFQVAWGELWAVEGPVARERMTFMDWTSTGPEERDEALPPTFLYAMPFAEDRLFVEETVLAARLEREPASHFEPLARRLHRRLDRRLDELGIRRVGEPLERERCIIPMGGPLPRGDQRTLAFGGAASMVHPATGYLLTNVLRRREPVADAIAEELERWVSPGAPSRRIWQAIWPPTQVRAWRLYGFGLEVIAGLDRPGVDRFFDEFFELPEASWRGFVSASAATPELMATMLRYFVRVSRPIRGRLSSALLGREGLRMLRGFAGLRS